MEDSPTLRQLGALISQQTSPDTIADDTWPEIIQTALQHGVASMLLWSVRQAAPDVVTEPLWTPVIQTKWNTAANLIKLETASQQVSQALADADIPSLWLKGIALAYTVYPQPSLRPMGDLDVLVPYEQRQDALRRVEELGYHFYETDSHMLSSVEILELNLTHHFHLRGGWSDSVILELHFQLLSSDNKLLPLDKLAWFWTQTNTQTGIVPNGNAMTILQPEAHLLYLIAHALLQHGETNIALRQFLDMHLLIANSAIDWDKVVRQAVTWGWCYAVERALTLTTQYFGTAIPDDVFHQLQENAACDTSAQRAMRFAGKGAQLEHVLSILSNRPTRDKIRLVRLHVFPSKAYMRTRYRLRPGQRVWPFYLYRWWHQGRESGWAIWNRLARRLRR